MPNVDTATVPWGREAVVLNAAWLTRPESPLTLVERIDQTLAALSPVLGAEAWDTTSGTAWAGAFKDKASLVEAGVTVDADGELEPESGYAVALSAHTAAGYVEIRVHAAATYSGRRTPANRLNIVLAPNDGAAPAVVEALLTAVVEAWAPDVASVRSREVGSIARRGGWKIPAAERLWLAAWIGGFVSVADGLMVDRTSKGSLLRVPDEWPADKAVAAVLETLDSNGLDLVPAST